MVRNKIVAIAWPKYSLLYFVMIILVHKCRSLTVDRVEILPEGSTLTGNQILVSKNGTFALGFFNPNNSENWYIGIWCAKISEKTIVWVANRENPLRNMPGVLNLSKDGYLRLFDLQGRSVWSSNNSMKASQASMLESGNLVMVGTRAENISEIVWESFQHPVDTWLPGMKLWKGMKLTSWKSSADPAPGPFHLQMDPSPGKTQLLLFSHNNGPYWSSGEWSGKYFTNMQQYASPGSLVKMVFVTRSPSIMYCTYTISNMTMGRATLEKNGEFWASYIMQNSGWIPNGFGPRDQCNVYGVQAQKQSCLGFTRVVVKWLCSPKSVAVLSHKFYRCFFRSEDKHLADDEGVLYSKEQTLNGCQLACLNNCSCMAFSVGRSSPPLCRFWFGDLMNVRDSPGGQSFYLRMAPSELEVLTSKARKKSFAIHILIPLVAAGIVLVLFLVMFVMWKRGRVSEEDDVLTSLRTFSFRQLRVATKNFSYKLGSGSFGSVFKGTLPDKTLVAVKRLEGSAHAEKQFRAEISTIGEIQHVNLVRLWGFCAEGSRRLLVYEYMPNGSLDSFLFYGKDDENQGKLLNWQTRFQIALGTARALAYLHNECRDRIIHCDIKPENILLDAEFCPKLADFGLAKLVGRDFSRVLTTTRGTIGYLAPEWISGLPITEKADVYSFGMTLLEIISGRRNLDINVAEPSSYYFPPWAADQLHKGNLMAIVDGRIAGEADAQEVRRAVAASMLCIQRDENVRPAIAQVVQILQGTVETKTTQFQASLDSLRDHH